MTAVIKASGRLKLLRTNGNANSANKPVETNPIARSAITLLAAVATTYRRRNFGDSYNIATNTGREKAVKEETYKIQFDQPPGLYRRQIRLRQQEAPAYCAHEYAKDVHCQGKSQPAQARLF